LALLSLERWPQPSVHQCDFHVDQATDEDQLRGSHLAQYVVDCAARECDHQLPDRLAGDRIDQPWSRPFGGYKNNSVCLDKGEDAIN